MCYIKCKSAFRERDVRDSAEPKIDHQSLNKDEVQAERGGRSKFSVIFSINID